MLSIYLKITFNLSDESKFGHFVINVFNDNNADALHLNSYSLSFFSNGDFAFGPNTMSQRSIIFSRLRLIQCSLNDIVADTITQQASCLLIMTGTLIILLYLNTIRICFWFMPN